MEEMESTMRRNLKITYLLGKLNFLLVISTLEDGTIKDPTEKVNIIIRRVIYMMANIKTVREMDKEF